jgi:hypothetical protein
VRVGNFILTRQVSISLDSYNNNCIESGGFCLARLLGDCVLRFCRQESDPMTVAVVYLDFLYFLETLMQEKPTTQFHSRVAQAISDNKNQRNTQGVVQPTEDADTSMDMDASLMSQFACPVKYSTEPLRLGGDPGTVELPEQMDTDENLLEEMNCWLHPLKYEDPFGDHNLCQCRKTLVGSGVFILKTVFDSWRKSHA